MSAERRFVGVIRRTEGLLLLGVEQTEALPWSSAPLDAIAVVADHTPLAAVEMTLDDVPSERRAHLRDLSAAWRRLAAARVTPASLADLLHVLVGSALEEPVDSGIGSLRGAEPLPAFRPTAAHPRAYEGTGARPPKPRAPRRLDLRSAALDPRAVRLLLTEFAGMLPDALRLLPDAVATDARALVSCGSADRAPGGWDGTARPRHVRTLVGLATSTLPHDEVAPLLGALRRHGRNDAPSLHLAAAWCITQGTPEAALAWLLAALRLHDRLCEVALMVWAGAGSPQVDPGHIPLAEIAGDHDDAPRFAFDLWSMLDAQRRGVDPRLLLPAVELRRGADLRRHVLGASPRAMVGAAPLAEFAISRFGDHWQPAALDLWRGLSSTPGFAEVFLTRPWADVGGEAVDTLVRSIGWQARNDERGAGLMGWWKDHLAVTVDALRDVPATHRAKLADTVGQCVDLWRWPDKLTALWPDLLTLARRLSAPPFRPDTRAVWVWNNLIELHDPALRRRVVEAPDRLWLRLEKRSRVPAAASLLGIGFDTLRDHRENLLAEAFLMETPLLFEVARLLGGLSPASADVICRLVPADIADPVAWLESLRIRVLEELGAGDTADANRRDIQHALLLQRSIPHNRRALRRLLRAHSDGDADYVLRHPLTRRWLAAHPTLPLDTWLEGVSLDAEVDGVGPLALRVERQLLEVLQLGTYVGSCLSLGGLCDYSAAAVALDVNKQVVYARTRRGGVVARQLVAVSDDDRLVAFSVYPRSAPAPVRRVFAEFDRRFAAALGLRLCTARRDATYTVAEILSQAWWDDGAWKSAIEDGRGHRPAAPRATPAEQPPTTSYSAARSQG